MAGVPSQLAPASFLSRSLRCQSLLFPFRAFSAACSDCGLPADFCCGGAALVFSEDCSLESLSVSFSGRFPLGQHWSRCWLLWMRALALALFAALTSLSQGSYCRPTLSIHNFIKGLSPSYNVRPSWPSKGAQSASNSNRIDWRCSRWAAKSWTSSSWCWDSLLILLQTLPTNGSDSPRLCFKKALNSSQGKGAAYLRLVLVLCCCQRWRMPLFKKDAAKSTRLWPLAAAVSK